MAMSPETIARRKADRDYQKRMAALTPIADSVTILTDCTTRELSTIEAYVDGVALKGLVRDVNPVLEKLGYRPVRLTSNMLNPQSKVFAIDINTPAYCDPGCESYHTM